MGSLNRTAPWCTRSARSVAVRVFVIEPIWKSVSGVGFRLESRPSLP